jgi:hypothetical protein
MGGQIAAEGSKFSNMVCSPTQHRSSSHAMQFTTVVVINLMLH